MAYSRRKVTDGVTVMNKDLYDNVQDGIDEVKEAHSKLERSSTTMLLQKSYQMKLSRWCLVAFL